MGALAPVFHWIPDDDLLLKNAIEVLNHSACNSINSCAHIFFYNFNTFANFSSCVFLPTFNGMNFFDSHPLSL